MKSKQIIALVLIIAMLLGMSIVLISSVNAESGKRSFAFKNLFKEGSALSEEVMEDKTYVTGIPENTPVADLKTNFLYGVSVLDKSGTLKGDDETVMTGDIVMTNYSGRTPETALLCVKGDVNGSGTINVTDYIQIKRHFLDTYKLEGIYEKAADTDGDGKVDTTDIIVLKHHFIKISGIASAFRRIEDEIILPTVKPVPVVMGALNEVNYNSAGGYETFTDASFMKKLSAFSDALYEMSAKEGENYSVSPLSVYFALAVLNAIGDDGVKEDIETLFGMDQSDIAKAGALFKSLITEKKDDKGVLTTKLDLTNSVWIDTGEEANKSALDEIAGLLYCYAYGAPFHDDNKEANDMIRQFIKEKTNGLIDNDFGLKPETLLAIINTLYFKDIWGYDEVYTEKRDFDNGNTLAEKEFILGEYKEGGAYETDVSYSFYAETYAGYKIKFILPKEGKTLAQAMTASNLDKVNAKTDYTVKDEKYDHVTRCIFPSFSIECDTPLKDILQANGYLDRVFSAFQTTLISDEVFVSDIKHKVALNVDKKGIEGAAVTILVMEATAIPPEKPVIRHDLVMDKNFGFLITDKNDVILFAGQVVDP